MEKEVNTTAFDFYLGITEHGHISDTNNDEVPPVWSLNPGSLVIDDGIYEVRAVPLTSIILVTDRMLKVRFLFT